MQPEKVPAQLKGAEARTIVRRRGFADLCDSFHFATFDGRFIILLYSFVIGRKIIRAGLYLQLPVTAKWPIVYTNLQQR